VKLKKETLAYFWIEFKDDGKCKSCCIGALALLFICIFGRMLLTVGLENIKKFKKILGTLYDTEEQKVSLLGSIVDQSHSIIKKGAPLKNNVIWMNSKAICNHLFVPF
jgi:hypothetical protein